MESQEPVNVAGIEFIAVKKITVMEFHELEDGEGDPSQVHLWLEMDSGEFEEIPPFVVRFHSPKDVDELIVALMTHRRRVWG